MNDACRDNLLLLGYFRRPHFFWVGFQKVPSEHTRVPIQIFY